MMTPNEEFPLESKRQLFNQAIELIFSRLRSSQPVPLEELLGQFPTLEAELREICPALLLADQLRDDTVGGTPPLGSEASATVDKDLLYAAFGMQCGVLSFSDFVAAFEAWNADRSTSLKQLLCDRGFVPSKANAVVERLFEQQLSLSLLVEEATVAYSGSGTPGSASAGFASPASAQSDGGQPTNDATLSRNERYQFVRSLDRGGLGIVSVAFEQDLNREVAIKEIREDKVGNITLRNKFLLEAQVTGGLEHPGIVPIYAFGHSPDGRPYYAMRLIKGNNLQIHIRAFHENLVQDSSNYDSPELRRLLRRFIDVCHAIEYAHSRGILHRDIKPVNIMLGKYGETLVVDWGLAKEVGESLQVDSSHEQFESIAVEPEQPLTPSSLEAGSQTRLGAVVGTPAYASPEQLTGQLGSIGVESDVYSLGATLFELLCGETPVSGGLLQILWAVASKEVRSPRSIQPMVPKPLEAICMKAVALDAAARYPSVQHLRVDIERWLDDYPVSAFPEPWHLRVRRWLRKNPTTAATIVASALIMTLGLTSFSAIVSKKNRTLAQLNVQLDTKNTELADTNQQLEQTNLQLDRSIQELDQSIHRETTARVIAQEQSELALSTLSSVVLDIQSGLKNLPRGSEIRRRLLATSLERLDQVATKVAEKATADRSTMIALIDLGELIVQFGTEPNSQLAPLAGAKLTTEDAKSTARMALQALERAQAIAVSRQQQTPQEPQALIDLGRVTRSIAAIHYRLGDTTKAIEMSQDSLSLSQTLVALEPDNTSHRLVQATACHSYGDFLFRSGRTDEAKELFEQELAIYRELRKANPDESLHQEKLAYALEYLADARLRMEEPGQAEGLFDESIGHLRSLVQKEDFASGQATALGRILWKQSLCRLRLGDIDGAALAIAESGQLYQAAASLDPDDSNLTMFLSNVLEREGMILERATKFDLAVEKTAESLHIREKLLQLDPADSLRARQVSVSQDRLGLLELKRGNPDQAKKYFEDGLEIAKKLAEEDPTHYLKQRDLYLSQVRMASLFEELGQYEPALELRRQAITICEKAWNAKQDDLMRKRDWMIAIAEGANTYGLAGQLEDAAKLHLRALQVSDELRLARPDSIEYLRDQSIVLEQLSANSNQLGHVEDAVHYINRCIEVRSAIVAINPNDSQAKLDLAGAYNIAAEALGNLNRLPESLEHSQAGVKILDELVSVDAENLAILKELAIAETRLAVTHSKQEEHDLAVERIRSSWATCNRLIDRPSFPFEWLTFWSDTGKIAAQLEFNAKHVDEAKKIIEQLNAKLEALIREQSHASWAEGQMRSMDDLSRSLGLMDAS